MARLPEVKSVLNLTTGEVGYLLLALAIGSLIGLPLAARLVNRYGARKMVRLFSLVASFALVCAGLGTTYQWSFWVMLISLFFIGFGSGVWDVSQNLEGTVIEQRYKKSVMPWFHAAFSAGTVLGAIVTFISIKLNVSLLTQISIVAAAIILSVYWVGAVLVQ